MTKGYGDLAQSFDIEPKHAASRRKVIASVM
jgi:hypothetical protein